MAVKKLDWLASALARQLAMLASRGHRKSAECFPFDGANEASIVLLADRVFSGLGFLTWPEQKIYDSPQQRLDLSAESPAGDLVYLIEGKVVWDGGDMRLNRKRFFESRELLGDFERLSNVKRAGEKLVVWIGFSTSSKVERLGLDSKQMRLGDALDAISDECPAASLQGRDCVDLEQFCECPEWKFAHTFCWRIEG